LLLLLPFLRSVSGGYWACLFTLPTCVLAGAAGVCASWTGGPIRCLLPTL